ncbi:hypothetical protein BSL82_09705 [Tardibacter chloracetimidivorans]|uniref:Uncharacterized protein n=1 Tax=Tardibacter chloracetimidivorans TaxID=1921510 RepID=A0A1L3ZV72_9SPHN|nr:hypothetical protein [Tardibacter chloracetimidivorans]API59556.1 hypothetical protein BSL82_09705 [Tardibacter chloracetimidivorans]
MAKKLYDVVATVGSYTDRQGNEKRRYENVGVMMEGDKGPYLMLKRTFNLAGVPSDRDTVLLSLYEPKDDQKQQTRGGQGGTGFNNASDLEDDVPFVTNDPALEYRVR